MNSADFETIAKACRYNSGSHFLDSGSAYGRHHEKPPIAQSAKAATLHVYTSEGRDPDITATLETAHYLAERCTVDEEITAKFEEWAGLPENSKKSWFEAGPDFCREVLGLYQHARDNTYNNEKDLSQNFVWEVWTANEDESDWVWAKDALCVIFVHTGCDVRGGYAKPLFLRHQGDYSTPIDFVAGFGISEGRDADGDELPDIARERLDQRWQVDYSSCPSAQVSKDVARVFWTGADWFIGTLKTGEIVKVYVHAPYI